MCPSTTPVNSRLIVSAGKKVVKYDARHGYSKWGRGVILVLADEKRRVFVNNVQAIHSDTGVIETSTELYEPR